MTIGIGGAGSKLAVQYDADHSVLFNVSEMELSKLEKGRKIHASIHSDHGEFRGSRKDPGIGREAFLSVKRELMNAVHGDLVFSSTGGGTGNGMTSSLLTELTNKDTVAIQDKTSFALVMPYAKQEPSEFVVNTVDFLRDFLSPAIDSGNTGNIFLMSNQVKFQQRLPESEFNEVLTDSLHQFTSIPQKGELFKLLDGHIDHEDFSHYMSKPYFNHFTYFEFNPEEGLDRQLQRNYNAFLLPPENPIEAMFLLEVPEGKSPTPFYDVLDYFNSQFVTPIYSVLENPVLDDYFLTVSLLYSRKPAELVEDFNQITQKHAQNKVRKSLEQHLNLPALQVNMEDEAKKAAEQQGTDSESDDVLSVLKRLGKL